MPAAAVDSDGVHPCEGMATSSILLMSDLFQLHVEMNSRVHRPGGNSADLLLDGAGTRDAQFHDSTEKGKMTTPLPVGKYIAGGEEFGKRLAKVERWVNAGVPDLRDGRALRAGYLM